MTHINMKGVCVLSELVAMAHLPLGDASALIFSSPLPALLFRYCIVLFRVLSNVKQCSARCCWETECGAGAAPAGWVAGGVGRVFVVCGSRVVRGLVVGGSWVGEIQDTSMTNNANNNF